MVSPGSFGGSLWALQGTQLLSWAPEQLRLNSDLGQSRGAPGLAWGVSSQPSCACSPGGSGGGEGCRASTLRSLVPEAFRALHNSLGFTGTLLLDTDTQILLSWHGEAQTAQGVAQPQGHGKMKKQVCCLLSTNVIGQEGCSVRQYPI